MSQVSWLFTGSDLPRATLIHNAVAAQSYTGPRREDFNPKPYFKYVFQMAPALGERGRMKLTKNPNWKRKSIIHIKGSVSWPSSSSEKKPPGGC